MRKVYPTKLFLLAIIATIFSFGASAQTASFNYTGSMQTYSVPSGVTSVYVVAVGASGGYNSNYSPYGSFGGNGGVVQCNLAVTPGQVYDIYVGGSGGAGSASTGGTGGYNGGAAGAAQGTYGGGGGGGGSDVRISPYTVSNRVVVAGGGGGAGIDYPYGGCAGGGGGGTTGQNGMYAYSYSSSDGGYGGTPTTGGAGGDGGLGGTGTFGSGGVGYSGEPTGGGGGGWYGGGGSGYWSGGGGGSSYAITTLTSNVYHSQGGSIGANGYVLIIPLPAGASGFGYTGSVQTYVPTVASVTVLAAGACGGNNNGVSWASAGGYGGAVACSLAVTPGVTYDIYVGGPGGSGFYTTNAAGGYNGGGIGTAYSSEYGGGGGGGGTDIRISPYALANRVVCAGGGGGAGLDFLNGCLGGGGGGTTGQGGMFDFSYGSSDAGGGGGTSTGGAGGDGSLGVSGSFGTGGAGYSGDPNGGGGGGWYGGGGSGYWAGGGGGSSYTDPVLGSSPVHTQGSNSGVGFMVILPNCSAGTIAGTPSTCVGFNTTLSDGTTGGAWSSSATSVGTISSGGIFTGISVGTTTVSYGGTFACGTVYSTQVVNVTAPPTFVSGNTNICQTFTNNLTFSVGGTSWTSSNTTYANVTSGSGTTGVVSVSGVSAGSAIITYNVSATCYTTLPVTILQTAPVTGGPAVCAGLTTTYSEGVAGGTWSSSNVSYGTVLPTTGVVTGISQGALTISYTQSNGCIMTGPLTVNPLPAIPGGTLTVCNGLPGTVTDITGGGTWNSGNTAVATIGSTTGIATGVSAGSTQVTYTLTATGCINNATFNVNPLPATISANDAVCIGLNTTLTDATSGGTWSSGASSIGSIGSVSGIVGGVTAGTTMMTYTLIATGCLNSTPFAVNPLPLPITGMAPVCVGQSLYLSDMTGGGIGVYSSASPTISIGGSGLTGMLTGVSAGAALITYQLPTTCQVTTTLSVLTTPGAISGGTASLCSGLPETLTAGPSGGTWSTSNVYLATIDPTLGALTSISGGTPTLTYMLSDGCYSTLNQPILNSPAPITGLYGICKGSTTTLADATTGGTWSTTGGFYTVGASSGFVTGLSAGNSTVTYLISNGCKALASFTVNALPTAQTLAGGGNYCIGGSGSDLSLGSTTQTSVTYTLYDGASPVGYLSGNGGVLDFGMITAAGTYTVQATTTAGCTAEMGPVRTVSISALPVDSFALLGGGGYCPSSNGVDLYLANTESLTSYTLYSEGMVINTVNSTGGTIDFNPTFTPGPYTYSAGNYTVVAQNLISGCQTTLTSATNVYLYTTPDAYNVTGGGNYCPYGSGMHVGLDYSTPGIEYSLYNGGTTAVETLSGASASLDFGLQPVGTYSITATNTLSGCTNEMNGAATVSTYLLPTAYAVGGGGSYCAGTSGVDVNISPSDPGFYYQLYNVNTPVGPAIEGNTGLLDFGNQVLDSTYTVVATDGSSGCYNEMTGSVAVTILPAPMGYSLSGGGAYCAGTGGVAVGLTGSQTGVNYVAVSAGVAVTAVIAGTSDTIGLGMDSVAGNYTVVATNATTGCMATMPGSGNVTINALPIVYNVMGGGAYCSGTTGVHINLDHSATGINYTMYRNDTVVGTVTGSNAALDFGAQTAPGTYGVTGVNAVTGCGNVMNNTVNVSINPSPAEYIVSSTASSYCIGGSGVTLNLNGSDMGLSYQLFLNGVTIGGAVTGSGTPITFGLQTGVGTYAVQADNTSTGCIAMMTATPVVTLSPLPEQFNVTGGGSYCAGGTGVTVGLNSTTNGFMYNLYNSAGSMVSSVTGSGGVITFAPQTGAGWYKAVAVNPVTTCSSNMNDSALVGVNALPMIDTITGGGGYCAGTSGVHIGLNTSSSGISYSLYSGGSLASTVSGSTGSSVDFGLMTATGSYHVMGTDMATGCQDAMYGTTTVAENALPPVYTMFGGGGYCSGTSGVHVNLSGSTSGINYQLYFDGVATGSAVSATGVALDFGLKSAPGSYTAIATDPATNCSSAMTGVSTVVINPLPNVYSITGGGNYCSGGAGTVIGVSNSDIGYTYNLYNGGTHTGTSMLGSGLSVSFGPQSVAGSYSVVSSNNTTGCSSTMTGTASVGITPLVAPMVTLSSGPEVNLCAGDVLTITASPTNGGTTPGFSWTVNTIAAGTGNTLTYVPSNGDMIGLTMTSSAACSVPLTAMASSLVNVVPYKTPTASITATPGTTVCAGTTITATAGTTNGGTAPTYTWLLNNTPVGSGMTYSYMPANNDVLEFMLQSNIACSTSDAVFSNTLLMESDIPYAPVVTLSAIPGTEVAPGTLVTIHADASNAGPDPVYQWLVNGVAMGGANGQTISSANWQDGDSVTCIVTSNTNACGSFAGTNSLKMKVTSSLTVTQPMAGGNLSVMPNPSNGNFTVKGTIGSTDEVLAIEVTDVLGQVVYRGTVKAVQGTVNEQVNLGSEIANGMYLLNITAGNGGTTFHIAIER